MGLLLSVLLAYAGGLEAIETIKHILSGVLPEGDPRFDDLVQHYAGLLQQARSGTNSDHWANNSGQGYLCIEQDDDGNLASAAVKYYGSDSTALLFSTKISSFGDSLESNSTNRDVENGNKQTPERYTSTTTTIIPNKTHSHSVGSQDRSPTGSYENISDPTRFLGDSFESKVEEEERSEGKEKLTWHYRPLSPSQETLPEIHFQSYAEQPAAADCEPGPDTPYSDDFLRSLDGVKFRPLQRSDPSGRRRSFKKRHSSSSTSSRDSSRASREEELRAFTSLEEAEFEHVNRSATERGISPSIIAHSRSRSRSQEKSKETKPHLNESWSNETSADFDDDTDTTNLKPKLRDLPKLGSFEEEKPEEAQQKEPEVNEEEQNNDDLDDFWGNSDD